MRLVIIFIHKVHRIISLRCQPVVRTLPIRIFGPRGRQEVIVIFDPHLAIFSHIGLAETGRPGQVIERRVVAWRCGGVGTVARLRLAWPRPGGLDAERSGFLRTAADPGCPVWGVENWEVGMLPGYDSEKLGEEAGAKFIAKGQKP
jgi:hypothetical protein